MKLDFSKVLIGMEGKPIIIDEKDLTLGKASILALRLNDPNDKFDGAEKLSRFMLGMKIAQATDPLELTIEEVAKLKDLTGKYLSVEVAGAAWLALEAGVK